MSLNPPAAAHNLTEVVDKRPLVGLGNLSALWNIEMSVNQEVIYIGLYRQAFGTTHVCPDNRKVRISGSPE